MGPPMRPTGGSEDVLVSVVKGDEGVSGVRRGQERNAHYSDGSDSSALWEDSGSRCPSCSLLLPFLLIFSF